MRSIRAVFYVFSAGIFVTGCGDGAELVSPPSKPELSYYCPRPCDPPPGDGEIMDPNCIGRPSTCPYDPVY